MSCDVAVLIDFLFECPARAHDVGVVRQVCFGLDFPAKQITQLFHFKVTGSIHFCASGAARACLYVNSSLRFALQVW